MSTATPYGHGGARQDHRHRRPRPCRQPRRRTLRGLFGMRVLAYDPYLTAERDRGARRREGRRSTTLLRRGRLRVDQLPADRETRGMIGAREFALMQPARLFHHHRARLHPRRGGAGRGAARQAHRRRRPRRLGQGAAAARPSAAAVRQRAGQPAHRRRHARGARKHGPHRRRADARHARRQAAAAHRQPRGLAGLRRGASSGPSGLRRNSGENLLRRGVRAGNKSTAKPRADDGPVAIFCITSTGRRGRAILLEASCQLRGKAPPARQGNRSMRRVRSLLRSTRSRISLIVAIAAVSLPSVGA